MARGQAEKGAKAGVVGMAGGAVVPGQAAQEVLLPSPQVCIDCKSKFLIRCALILSICSSYVYLMFVWCASVNFIGCALVILTRCMNYTVNYSFGHFKLT
jgi:hypothetical protein